MAIDVVNLFGRRIHFSLKFKVVNKKKHKVFPSPRFGKCADGCRGVCRGSESLPTVAGAFAEVRNDLLAMVVFIMLVIATLTEDIFTLFDSRRVVDEAKVKK